MDRWKRFDKELLIPDKEVFHSILHGRHYRY